jgi:hypothetical protein
VLAPNIPILRSFARHPAGEEFYPRITPMGTDKAVKTFYPQISRFHRLRKAGTLVFKSV